MATAKIGIFGGSGFYSLFNEVKEIWIDTPFGPPSDKIALATFQGKEIAFLPRHGKNHHLPPHKINYKANIWAMKQLGVKFIIAPTAAGSLQKQIKPGEFVVVNQFVDRTSGRLDTYYDGPLVTHIAGAQPYCEYLREVASKALKKCELPYYDKGTVVVIKGPRFSTAAESKWFTNQGWEVINMTQYPEVVLARELEISYVNISLITDYDAGLEGIAEAVTAEEALKTFAANNEKLKKAIKEMLIMIDISKKTPSHEALKTARF